MVGIRVKGGVMYDHGVYFAVINVWQNIDCIGEPEEFRHPREFRDEQLAFAFYEKKMRPLLASLGDIGDINVVHKKIDELIIL